MKNLYALLGPAGAGKSTYIKNASKEIFGDDRLLNYVVSPDDIRLKVQSPKMLPNGTYRISMDSESFVWGIIHDILDRKVEKGETIIVDATHSRNSALNAYKKYAELGYRVYVIDFRDIPLETILKQNRNRDPLKFVPEDHIETMYERIQYMSLPGWIEVLSRDEFIEHMKQTTVDYNPEDISEINVIGDIHGCKDEFLELLNKMDLNPEVMQKDKMVVFVGDYFDRGPKIIETFKVLQQLAKTKKVFFLTGNHEEPLRHLKKMYQFGWDCFQDWLYEITKEDSEVCSITVQKQLLKYKAVSWKKHKELIPELMSIPDCYADFRKYFLEKKLEGELAKTIKNTSRFAMKLFFLSGIPYTEVARFQKRLAQIFYVTYGNKKILITHGGLPTEPNKLTPTSDLIRGVGTYGDEQLVAETFHKLHPETIQVFGHRNISNLPTNVIENAYNVNGDVDIGLRGVKIVAGVDEIKTYEVEPTEETLKFNRARQIKLAQKFKAKKLTPEEEKNQLLNIFQDHAFVDVKKLPTDIVAINFTKKAFEKGVWDEITVKARGLFCDNRQASNDEIKVIARGYEKFFNLGEKHGLSSGDLKSLVYPVYGYEKANGYLGILSVDDRGETPEWFISSKSTTVGPFAEKFRTWIEPLLTESLKSFLLENNLSLTFEVVDPDWDPHIQEYSAPVLVLLDAIKNEITFEKLPYNSLQGIVDLFEKKPEWIELRKKELLFTAKTSNELMDFIRKQDNVNVLNTYGVEGTVFEDSSTPAVMFKTKTKWYSFWKYQRSQQDRIVRMLNRKKDSELKVLSKSELLIFRERLHTSEEIKAFEALKTLIETREGKPFDSVPQLRYEVLNFIKNITHK